MNVAFEGIGAVVATFDAAEDVQPGDLVKVTGNGRVEKAAADGDVFAGVAISVHAGEAAVQVAGFVQAACAGALSVGTQAVAVDETGKVESVETGGRTVTVAAVENGSCWMLL